MLLQGFLIIQSDLPTARVRVTVAERGGGGASVYPVLTAEPTAGHSVDWEMGNFPALRLFLR